MFHEGCSCVALWVNSNLLKYPKAFRWNTGDPRVGCLEPPFAFSVFFQVWVQEHLSQLYVYVGCFLDFFVPFSPRPPCLPPKPQKMRRPRPLSVYSHRLFNGSMETFIKVLAGEPWSP